MIGYNYKYKGFDMSDDKALENSFVITDVNKNLALRTTIREKQNYHGATSTPTLASGRLFTFSFEIFGTREERAEAQRKLESVIRPEFNPGKTKDNFPLYFTTDEGIDVKIQAQVFGAPRYNSMELGAMNVSGSFELFAPDPVYKGVIVKSNAGGFGSTGGMKLGTTLGVQMNKRIAEVSVQNNGTWASAVRIEVIGEIENPRIKNLTAGNFYGLNRTTNHLVIDGTQGGLIVTDGGVNVKADRMSGSEVLQVIPGINTYILEGDNFTTSGDVEWFIFYNDSFL